MDETKSQILSGVAETLLIPLYIRAMESQRPDALMKDEQAEILFEKFRDDGLYDFEQMKSIHLSEANKLVIILRNRQFDRITRGFLARHPQSVVVHIGCGFDTRFERVDNGQVEWFDLDLPGVIELRQKWIGGERERYHLLGCSVLDAAWLEAVRIYRERPFLFLAEGVLMYFEEVQVKSLVRTLLERFPGAELVFDSFSPIHVLRSNLQIASMGFRMQWGIWHGEEVEKFGDDIHLLDEWGFFDEPEPRLASIRWLRPIESLARTMRIYHFRLNQPHER